MEVCSGKDITVIGGIYRHPSHNIKTCCSRFEMSLEIIRNHDIPCVISGDFYINLTKYKVNSDTSDYLNTLILNNCMPTIILPTRITKNSSTLIDHIYYYQGRHINRLK